jgi:hypothetical protein
MLLNALNLATFRGTWAMKSERRHELQHNILLDWLATTGESLKPYQNIILSAVTLLLVVLAAYTWWSREAAQRTTVAWDELNTAVNSNDPTALTKVMEDRPGTTVADMAALISADEHLAAGCEQLFENKATAQQELSKAIELYSPVRERTRVPSLQERAMFGLARAKEARGEATDLVEALQLYEDVAKTPNGAYTAAAQQRADDLKRPGTKALYDRFAQFDPKPVFVPGQGEKPGLDMNSLPNDSPLTLPSAASESKPDEKATEPGKADETKPADETKVPDEKMPPDEKKPSEEPAK